MSGTNQAIFTGGEGAAPSQGASQASSGAAAPPTSLDTAPLAPGQGDWAAPPNGAPSVRTAPHPGHEAETQARKTLIFANDKSSGKTTTANAVLVSLLERYPHLMRGVMVREYDRQPRLANIFRREDGLASVQHLNARNAAAYDAGRELAYDPNATPWDDLLFHIGAGGLIVDLGANIFADICRILDDEPRPVFPDGGETIGVVVPVTTAADSIESAITAIEAAASWGPRVQIFVVEQEYLGRFTPDLPEWPGFRGRMQRHESARLRFLRVEKLAVADIGRVMYQRIDRMVADAQAILRSSQLQGADYIRAIRKARAEVGWGAKTLEAVRPIADWYAR